MSASANTVNGSFDSRRATPAVLSVTRPFYWSVRRELWEYKAIYIAPLAAAVVFLVGFAVTAIGLPATMRDLAKLDLPHFHDEIVGPYDLIAALLMATTILVTVFYCLDALYGERRDRSIMFWKSLPVSDTTAVLAKATIPFVVLPLLTFAIALITQFIMLLLSSAILLASGQSAADLWAKLPIFRMSWLLLYHIFTAHLLWPAPIYCWLLLISAYARRAPLLWALLPPFAIAGLERIIFHTWHFATMLGHRFLGDSAATAMTPRDAFPTEPMTHITPDVFLSSPGLWIGLALAAVFLFAAVRLRRQRGPI
jgi:ABC-2 type transport system permease protein